MKEAQSVAVAESNAAESNEILKIVDEAGVQKKSADNIINNFIPFLEQVRGWQQKAEGLVVTEVTQIEEMKQARQARLALKNIRVEADKIRKKLKEDSLRYGKAVQGVYNLIEASIKPIEEHLEEQEKFIERQKAKREAELKMQRELEILPYQEFVLFGVDLGKMSDEDYQKLLNGAKLQLKAKEDAEKQAEKDRLDRERKEKVLRDRQEEMRTYWGHFDWNVLTVDLPEKEYKKIKKAAETAKAEYVKQQEEIRKENERLKKEAEEVEKKQAAERKVAEEKLEAERQAKSKLEAELKSKQDQEEKDRQAAEEEREKAEMSPDKDKLLMLADSVISLPLPEVKSEKAKVVLAEAKDLLEKLSQVIKVKVSTL